MRLLGFKNLRRWDPSFRWAMLMIAAWPRSLTSSRGLLDAGMTAAKALERGFRLLPHPCSAYAYRRCFITSNSIQKSLPYR